MEHKWTKIVKSAPGKGGCSLYPFDDTPCIYVYGRGDVKLSTKSHDLLGKAPYAEIFSDGNGNLGIRGATVATGNYVIGHSETASKKGSSDPRRIACKLISKKYHMNPDQLNGLVVYAAIFEDGLLVINTKQTPLKIR